MNTEQNINSTDLYDHLKCSICKNFCEKAVECAQCNVIFCKECQKGSTCVVCKKNSIFNDSAFANRLIGTLPTKCKYCEVSTFYSELKYHYPKCPNRPISCLKCNFQGSSDNFRTHLNDKHIEVIVRQMLQKIENRVK